MKPIEKMSYRELKEAQLKQKALLSNSNLLKALPDKGEKLADSFKKINERLESLEQITDMLDAVKLSQPKVDINKMEWTGIVSPQTSEISKLHLETPINEGDETHIIEILSTANETDKIIIQEREDDCSVEKEQAFKPEKFIQNLIERVSHADDAGHKFKPYSTLNQNPSIIRMKSPPTKKPASKCQKPMWENTAATPPLTKFEKGIIELDVQQSLQVQIQTDDKLRGIESQLSSLKIGKNSSSLEFAAYSGDGEAIPDEEEIEVHDIDDGPDTKEVVFRISSFSTE